jgi:nucleoid-associated protein YgaU
VAKFAMATRCLVLRFPRDVGLAILALCLSTAVYAAELTGTVTEVSDDSVKISLDHELVPNAGDEVKFFFKIPGLDDEIPVGTGVVSGVDGQTVSAKFKGGTGMPQTGNLVRIHSANPQNPTEASAPAKPAQTPVASTPPPPAKRSPTPPLTGSGTTLTYMQEGSDDEFVVYVAHGKARFYEAQSENDVTLFDPAAQTVTELASDDGTYVVMDLEALRRESGVAVDDEPPTLTYSRTGRTRNVVGYECQDWKLVRDARPPLELCIASGDDLRIPREDQQVLQQAYELFKKIGETGLFHDQGVALRVRIPGEGAYVLKRIDIAPLAADLFQVPAGYDLTPTQPASSPAARAREAELTGTVTDVSGDSIKIALDSDLVPNTHDKVEFFFTIPGLDDEIAVGTGVVTSVKGDVISARFEEGSGIPKAGNLVRIHSANPRKPAKIAASAKPKPAPVATTPLAARRARTRPVTDSMPPISTGAPTNANNKPARGEVELRTYIVKEGDTLSTIVLNELGDESRLQEIAALNRIADPEKIYVGQALRIPDRAAVSAPVGLPGVSVPGQAGGVDAVASMAAPDVTFEYDTDRPGGDYRDLYLHRDDPQLCADECAREDVCRAWTYVQSNRRCWLKEFASDPVPAPIAISGAKPVAVPSSATFEYDTDRPGGDLGYLDLDTADPQLCAAMCAQHGRCRAWTYVKPRRCWLKAQVFGPVTNACCVSGVIPAN